MDSLKKWLLEVGLKQMGPSAIRGVILFIIGWLGAHAGILDKIGGHYDPASHLVTLNLDALQTWLEGAGLTAGSAALIKMFQYHATQMLPSKDDTPIVPPPVKPA